MKKAFATLIVVVCLAICAVSFTGCSGLKLVESITIITGGEKKTFSSSFQPKVEFKENYRYITKQEFDRAPKDRKYIGRYSFKPETFSKITVKQATKLAKGATCYEVVEKDLVGKYYWQYQHCSQLFMVLSRSSNVIN